MSKTLAANLNIPATFACPTYEEIAETAGLSTPPTGWRVRLSIAGWPKNCVRWYCAGCVRTDAAKGGE